MPDLFFARYLDAHILLLPTAEIDVTEIANRNFENMKYLFLDFEPLNEKSKLELDGLLGYPFLNATKISINYQKEKIYFWGG